MSTPLPGHMPGAEQVQYRIPGGQITFPPSYSSIPFQPITTQPGVIPTEQFGSHFGLQGPDPAANIPYGLEYISTLDTIIVYRDRRMWVCDPIKHSIRNANQEQIFYTMCQLQPETPYYNGGACAAVVHMGDNFQRQVLVMKVPYVCCGYDLEAAMECPPGQIRGRFMASQGCSALDVAINDINGNPILSVTGTGTCTAREYQIIGMNGVQIGTVTWIGLWAAEWIIKCPVNLDVSMKASLICSDYCIQQRNNRSR